jgi:hypothetical protein
VISLESTYTDTQILIRTHMNIFFQMVSNDSILIFLNFFVILLSLAIDACLLTKIDFWLSRISTKIDFCGATGHDHGGW